jgi:hypothetical protein
VRASLTGTLVRLELAVRPTFAAAATPDAS